MQEFIQFPYRCVSIAMRFISQSLSHFLGDKEQVRQLVDGFASFAFAGFFKHGIPFQRVVRRSREV